MVDNIKKLQEIVGENNFETAIAISSWVENNFVPRKDYEILEKALDGYEYEIQELKKKISGGEKTQEVKSEQLGDILDDIFSKDPTMYESESHWRAAVKRQFLRAAKEHRMKAFEIAWKKHSAGLTIDLNNIKKAIGEAE